LFASQNLTGQAGQKAHIVLNLYSNK